MIVDLGYNQPPEIEKDPFWDGPIEPLYTQQSMIIERHMNDITGSLAHIRLPEDKTVRMMPLPQMDSTRNPFNYLFRASSWSRSVNETDNINDKELLRNIHERRRFSLGDYFHFPFRSTLSARASHDSINFIGEPHHLEDVKEENEDTVHSRRTQSQLSHHPQIPFPMSFPTENGTLKQSSKILEELNVETLNATDSQSPLITEFDDENSVISESDIEKSDKKNEQANNDNNKS
ncbi:unnamed protein product [Onchocerca ochengi]|uniref:Bestrophin homolog n=1 Tax=Onchocerca ochengi TaxID=42157 RepID=A0A182EIY6_ONCOC|nr:unnamed protein product [Onchocerca ochengi]